MYGTAQVSGLPALPSAFILTVVSSPATNSADLGVKLTLMSLHPLLQYYNLMLASVSTEEFGSWNISVGIATQLRAEWPSSRGSISCRCKRFFHSPQRRGRVWGPPSLLYNRYRGLRGRGVKLTTYPHLVSRLRTVELYLHYSKRLHDVAYN
jgi:hypothetical protein